MKPSPHRAAAFAYAVRVLEAELRRVSIHPSHSEWSEQRQSELKFVIGYLLLIIRSDRR